VGGGLGARLNAQARPSHSDTSRVQRSVEIVPALGALELEVTSGPWAGQRISVNEDYAVGSAETGPGTLGGDRWLSPSHARFHRGPDGWAIEDLRSLEGTKVNGRAIRGAATLHVGDVVELGSSRIVVLPHGQASVAQLHAESPIGVAEALREESRRELDGRRVLAVLIDAIVLVPVALLSSEVGRGRWIFWILGIGLCLNYYFLCESLTGQTLGKRVARLKVVRVDGLPLVPSRVAARTVLRLVDQGLACLVGMLTMVLSRGRRQRLGDLAARTAVVRSDAPGPRPARPTLRERLALFAYPCTWLAPFVLLYALVPDARVLPCGEVGISARSGKEGSCLLSSHGRLAVFDSANAGHTLHMPGFSLRLVRTTTRLAPARVRGAIYYRNDSTTVAAFELAVHNSSHHPIAFDRNWREVVLGVTRPDGLGTVPVRELPPRARPGFRSFGQYRRIAPGHTRVAWVSFGIPAEAVPQLWQPVAGLAILHAEPNDGYPHVGELRLWRAATPAGARALSGLHD
jgi:uncharacterized RDD family membrane protein YckC